MHVHGVLLGPDGKELFSQSNPGQVTLTGRNVVKIADLYNALAITDTNFKDSLNYDVSPYQELQLWCLNTHNQAVELYGSILFNGGNYTIADTTGNAVKLTLPLGMSRVALITPSDFKVLNAKSHAAQVMKFRAVAPTAPTSGSLTVLLMGRVN